MLKFSVLIPTRNRLEYLKYAISSVMKQDYDNWEVIISDNYSEDDIEGYVQLLGDERIKYFRTSAFVPVTDNWNNALEKSTGDYVIMLGDDDCLLQHYFKTCVALIVQYNSPDMLYTSALNYVYPDVLPEAPNGYLITWPNASFLSTEKQPYILDRQVAISLAQQALNFTIMFNFNAQFSLLSRTLINEFKKFGDFYQSPYPDYYSTTALFLKAARILAISFPMVVVGISPKSFGYYYFNNKEKEGIEMLKNLPADCLYQKARKFLMPGSNMNSSWLLAMEAIIKNFGKEFQLNVNYKKYRFLQVLYLYKKFACRENVTCRNLWEMSKFLFWWEKLIYIMPFSLISVFIRFNFKISYFNYLAMKLLYVFSHPSHGASKVLNNSCKNISEVFDEVLFHEIEDYKKTLPS